VNEGIYLNLRTFLELDDFSARDAKIFAFVLGAFLGMYPAIEVDFKGVKVTQNALNMLYDTLSYLYGVDKAISVYCTNTGYDKTQYVSEYIIKPINKTIC